MKVRFGLVLDVATPNGTLAERLRGYAPLVDAAEQLGFESVWACEGYRDPREASHVASPLVVLAALAPTTGLRLGTGVILLPSHDPLRLAYDCAILDQISGGRLTLGVAAGHAHVARRFGKDDTKLGVFANESLGLLRALWDGADGYHGSIVDAEGGMTPLPVQPGGPPIWVGGAVKASIRRAAGLGHGWYASTSYDLDKVALQSRRYREELAAAGRDATHAVVAANRFTVLAETPDEARSLAATYLGAGLAGYARAGSFGTDTRDALAAGTTTGADLFDRWDADFCLAGTPDEVADRVGRYASVGVTHLNLRVAPNEIPMELAMRSLQLFGRHVLPRFT